MTLQEIGNKMEQDLRDSLDRCGLMYRLFWRVKTMRSVKHKMDIKGEKYRSGQSKIQDIYGFRIVLYFQDDVDIVSFFLGRKGLVDLSMDSPDTVSFRPQRLNLVIRLPEEYSADFKAQLPAEYADYIDDTYEVQIRTIFSEGWHEVEHDLRYKCKEDWEGYEQHSRILNGVIAQLETAEWTMKALFKDMARRNAQLGNYRAMFRNLLHIRFASDDFSPQVTQFIEEHPYIAEQLLDMDNVMFMCTLMSHPVPMPLSFDNLLFLINRVEIMDEELQQLESNEFREFYATL